MNSMLLVLMSVLAFDSVQAETEVVVAVSIARQIKNPDLIDSKKRRFQETPTIIQSDESKEQLLEKVRHLEEAIDVLMKQAKGYVEHLEQLLKENEELKKQQQAPQPTQAYRHKIAFGAVKLSTPIPAGTSAPTGPPLKEFWVFTGDESFGHKWCVNCPPYLAKLAPQLAGRPDIKLHVSTKAAPGVGEQMYPAVRFKNDKGEWCEPTIKGPDDKLHYHIPGSLSEIEGYLQRLNEPEHGGHVAGGILGSIKGKEQIGDGIARFRQYIGYNNPVTFGMQRTGPQVFNILGSGQKLDAQSLLGDLGRFTINIKKGMLVPNTPSDIGFTYKVNGDDITIDIDPIVFRGLAKQLGMNDDEIAAMEAHPAGFIDPLTAWSIISMVRGIWGIFHPSCDLLLGGSVSCVVELKDIDGVDTIDISFKDAPQIRFVMLFQFMLSVRHITASTERVHLDFEGSRWITKTDFPVED